MRTGAAVGAGFSVLGEGDLDADEPEELAGPVEPTGSARRGPMTGSSITRLLVVNECGFRLRLNPALRAVTVTNYFSCST